MSISESRLSELRRLAEAASAGPWDKPHIYKFYMEWLVAIPLVLDHVADLERKLGVAKSALEFYSDCEGDVLDWDRVNVRGCQQDRGKRARQALKDIE